jgi:hypothetical protein
VRTKTGRPIDKGYIYKVLNNRTYLGEATHKGQVYVGEHLAIVSRDLWDLVHTILQESPRARANQNRAQSPALLRGLIFKIPELGRAVPYGVYDIAGNTGWVSVGIDHDTASFAVNAIRRWWQSMGQARYPAARSLVITADCGGSNGARVRLWKREMQVLANELGMAITVCHLPPGTSKWNRIEHRLFSFITQNWRGKPLVRA